MPFQPPAWLRNRHAQTLWAYLAQPAPSVTYHRESISTPDGDEVDLDWSFGEAGGPAVLICHGLEGNSDSPYVRRLVARANSRGWTAAVLHSRTCSGRPNRRVASYHSGYITDLQHVCPLVAQRLGERPLYLVGYSLGGSLVANYLGRCVDEVPGNVRGAFLCSAPLNLAPGAEALREGFNRVYELKFLLSLRKKVMAKGRAHQAWRSAAEAAARVRSLRDFDETWTAPVHGFIDAEDYYKKASAAPHLRAIQVPTRVLHADDDPFIIDACVPVDDLQAAASVTYTPTKHGGHVGFVSQSSAWWLEDEILDWLYRRARPLV